MQYYSWRANIFSLELKKFNKIKMSQGEFQKYTDTTVEMDRKKMEVKCWVGSYAKLLNEMSLVNELIPKFHLPNSC